MQKDTSVQARRDLCWHADHLGDVDALPDLARQAYTALVATRLTELGARAGLVRQLTGLEKKVVNRLYRQLHGRPSPSGLLPFSDAWFVQDPRRMLHAAVVWNLYDRLMLQQRREAEALIEVYEAYVGIVNTPLLTLTRAALVPRLVTAHVWQVRVCMSCATPYVTPVGAGNGICPGCERYQRFRCRCCGKALDVKAKGRRRVLCTICRSLAHR